MAIYDQVLKLSDYIFNYIKGNDEKSLVKKNQKKLLNPIQAHPKMSRL